MQFQLRTYRVKPGLMDEWLEAFAAGALPVRRQFGFSVLGPWVVRDEDRFIWIVGHEDFERGGQGLLRLAGARRTRSAARRTTSTRSSR